MRRTDYRSALAVAAILAVPSLSAAQGNEQSRAVAGGGINVPGWQGKIDAREEQGGMTINNAKLSKQGDVFSVTTGPAVTYWSPANAAAGNYTVKATFTEAKYMALNDHPHPYGIVIGGNDMGTAKQTYLYCAAYGNGNFIVRGFGPDSTGNSAPFSLGGRRPQANAAVNKAAGVGAPVTQEIAVTVKSDVVECAINGTVVATHPKAEVVSANRLKSTDGVFGIRFAHNTEATVTGLAVTKN